MLFLQEANIPKRTAVYIDGFNLYYGALKGGPNRWLDPRAMCQRVLGGEHDIIGIKYFTANVRAVPNDSGVQGRQQIYLKALDAHIPELEIIRGHFSRHRVWRQPVDGAPDDRVHVWQTEEKGSDVNLAVHLLNDAWSGHYEAAAIVSNDSDLVEAIRLVQDNMNLPIGLIPPTVMPGRRVSHRLSQVVSFIRPLRGGILGDCQLPNPIPGTRFYCPRSWRA